ncbi:MAG: ABC transporter substrate-binding protein [Rhodospirillaceae bacterium]|nr:ABC transporter substrate-binding protein [Rhodospirillaceae bacterium]
MNLCALPLAFLLLSLSCFRAAAAPAIAMHGTPKYGPNETHFAYANPDAPKGGRLVLGRVGSFDSLQHFIVRGARADGRRLSHQSLLARAFDEPFSLYGLIADDVSTPPDRSAVTFQLRPGARFHDGSEITVDDVIFSLEILRSKGRPNHRFYYGQVAAIEQPGPRTITFRFKDNRNRELPLIMGMMPILSRAWFQNREFDRVSLTPTMGSGPYVVDKVDPGRSVHYRRIKNHWMENLQSGKGQNNFDVIRYDYYRDDSAMLEAFKAGKVDLRVESDPKLWAQSYDFPARRQDKVRLEEFSNGRPAGMYAFALNSRRAVFRDPRVRAAMAYAIDFKWLNKTLFHGAYHRTRSYFENSELAATGLPGAEELELLAPFRDGLPSEVFTKAYAPPSADGSGRLRRNLRMARKLLAEAGWRIKDLRLIHESGGEPFEFEIMLVRRNNEKLALHLARNLKKLGIEVVVRTVDTAQYQQRTNTYDFDAMVYWWDPSLSPGNEQAFYWGTQAATREGTRNYPGIKVPAIDALVRKISDAHDRADLVNAVRAMDRVLQWGHYVIPLFHLKADRIALWDRFGRPQATPIYGYRLETWWEDPVKAAKIGQNRN